MKNLILFCFLIVLPLALGAQDDPVEPVSQTATSQEYQVTRFLNNDTSNPLTQGSSGRIYTFNKAIPDVAGNPYLSEEKHYGTIYTTDNQVLERIQFKYNIHKDCIELEKDGKAIDIFSYQISSFRFFDETKNEYRIFAHGFANYSNNFTELSYYEVIYNGDSKILVKHQKPIIRVNSQLSTPGVNTRTAQKRYSLMKQIYVQVGDEFKEIKLNRSSVLAAFGSSDLNKYVKSEKIRCRSIEDVVQVAEYYDQLK